MAFGYYSSSLTIRVKLASSALLLLAVTSASAQLSSTYYFSTYPSALSTIKSAVVSAVAKEAPMRASLLRLHFHDCFVNGCDASVLLDDTSTFTGEKTAPPNSGLLRGFNVIDTIKSKLETFCPGIVSCADIIAVAARNSIVSLGWPSRGVALGRRDATTTSLKAATKNIPSPASDLSALISTFSNKGFTAKELVALSDSHTIGQARCTTFRTRFYSETNTETSFATTRQGSCPFSGGNENFPLLRSSPF